MSDEESSFHVDCEYLDITEQSEIAPYTPRHTCLHLNIRSLSSNFDNLKVLMSELKDFNVKPDLVMLCETWLNANNCDLFNIPGYSLVEKHRKNGRGGGVCIFVKSGLRYKTREDISVFEEGTFESIFIELLDSKTVVGEVYRVPGTNLRLFMETYERVVKALANESQSVVIGTDQNIDLLRASDHSGTADFINMIFFLTD